MTCDNDFQSWVWSCVYFRGLRSARALRLADLQQWPRFDDYACCQWHSSFFQVTRHEQLAVSAVQIHYCDRIQAQWSLRCSYIIKEPSWQTVKNTSLNRALLRVRVSHSFNHSQTNSICEHFYYGIVNVYCYCCRAWSSVYCSLNVDVRMYRYKCVCVFISWTWT